MDGVLWGGGGMGVIIPSGRHYAVLEWNPCGGDPSVVGSRWFGKSELRGLFFLRKGNVNDEYALR